jgi:hypothetical protein
MLARSDFASAVKDALRHFTQLDMLLRSPLLRTHVMEARVTGPPTAQDLRVMLAETAELLFGNERDQKLYRVLELTYLKPAPKQEAAADRLGLSLSTYRRYLAAGINRIIDWLWEQEQNAPGRESALEHAATFRRAGRAAAPTSRCRLPIVVLPLLNLDSIVAGDVEGAEARILQHVDSAGGQALTRASRGQAAAGTDRVGLLKLYVQLIGLLASDLGSSGQAKPKRRAEAGRSEDVMFWDRSFARPMHGPGNPSAAVLRYMRHR